MRRFAGKEETNFVGKIDRVKMSDQPPFPIPPPPPGEHEEDIPPPPPPPADEMVSLEIDFEKLAERAAVIAREQQQQQQHQQQKKRKQRDSPSGKKNIPPPPMPPLSLGGTVLDEVDLERIKVGDNRWGITLSSCVEYPNKKYFFRYDAFVGVVCFSPNEYARISMTTRMMWMMPPVRFVFCSLSLSLSVLSSSSKNV